MSFVKVSVIIPTYNCARYIGEAIDSVLNQTYRGFEIIVADDGSTDNTKDILKPYINDELIHYIYQPNHGPSAARNTGINVARGEYIAFLDADDLWVPTKLEKQVNFLDNNMNVALVFSDVCLFDETGIMSDSFLKDKKKLKGIPISSDSSIGGVFARNIFDDLLQENFIPTKTVVVRKNCIEEVGGFDETLFSVEDLDMWLRISRAYEIGYIKGSLAQKRQHNANIGSNQKLALESKIRVLNKMLKMYSGLSLFERKLIKRGRGFTYFCIGYQHFSEQMYNISRKYFSKSIRQNPLQLKSYLYLFTTYCPESIIFKIRGIKKRIKREKIRSLKEV